jgi:hypothetical protein
VKVKVDGALPCWSEFALTRTDDVFYDQMVNPILVVDYTYIDILTIDAILPVEGVSIIGLDEPIDVQQLVSLIYLAMMGVLVRSLSLVESRARLVSTGG